MCVNVCKHCIVFHSKICRLQTFKETSAWMELIQIFLLGSNTAPEKYDFTLLVLGKRQRLLAYQIARQESETYKLGRWLEYEVSLPVKWYLTIWTDCMCLQIKSNLIPTLNCLGTAVASYCHVSKLADHTMPQRIYTALWPISSLAV